MSKSFLVTAIFFAMSVVSMAQEETKTAVISYNPNAQNASFRKSINAAIVSKIKQANVTISYHSHSVSNKVI